MSERPVLFDQAAYRIWLEQPTTAPDGAETSKYDAIPDLAVGWQRHEGQGGWLAEVVLGALRDDAGQQVWTYGPGVSGLRLWATEAPDTGADGGVVAEVTVDGVPLSLGHLADNELVSTGWDLMPGYEAAELALAELAERASAAAAHHRRSYPVGDLFGFWWGPLSGNEIDQALTTMVDVVNGDTDLSGPQLAVIDRVLALRTAADDAEITDDAEIVEGEIVD